MGAGYQSRWHPLQELLTGCPCLLLSVAVIQGLQCHLCKGFGGCSHPSDCPRRSTHCVTIATRECDGRDGLDTPFLHRELAHWAGRAQSPADQEHSRNMSGSLCLGQGPGFGSSELQEAPWFLSYPSGTPISFKNLPLVEKMCYNLCPDVPSLDLGPHVSIACCQSNLCNRD